LMDDAGGEEVGGCRVAILKFSPPHGPSERKKIQLTSAQTRDSSGSENNPPLCAVEMRENQCKISLGRKRRIIEGAVNLFLSDQEITQFAGWNCSVSGWAHKCDFPSFPPQKVGDFSTESSSFLPPEHLLLSIHHQNCRALLPALLPVPLRFRSSWLTQSVWGARFSEPPTSDPSQLFVTLHSTQSVVLAQRYELLKIIPPSPLMCRLVDLERDLCR